jgi:hypothetical protein
MKIENSLRYVKLLPLQGVWGKTSVINTKEILVDFRKSFEQAPSKLRASTKQPVSDLCPCGRIPQNAALLLAKTSDGPPTL